VIVITTGKKKRYSHLSGGCAIVITTGKKKIQSSVWRVRNRYYNRKNKKDPVVCLAGARSLLLPENKKVPVVCLAGAQTLLRPENKKVPVVCLAGA
jgi:hypothetical protein